jgi:hypothetical protein
MGCTARVIEHLPNMILSGPAMSMRARREVALKG